MENVVFLVQKYVKLYKNERQLPKSRGKGVYAKYITLLYSLFFLMPYFIYSMLVPPFPSLELLPDELPPSFLEPDEFLYIVHHIDWAMFQCHNLGEVEITRDKIDSQRLWHRCRALDDRVLSRQVHLL